VLLILKDLPNPVKKWYFGQSSNCPLGSGLLFVLLKIWGQTPKKQGLFVLSALLKPSMETRCRMDNELPLVRQRKHTSGLRRANATRLSIKLCHPVGFLIRQLQHLRLD
jgi:hypothetical protein